MRRAKSKIVASIEQPALPTMEAELDAANNPPEMATLDSSASDVTGGEQDDGQKPRRGRPPRIKEGEELFNSPTIAVLSGRFMQETVGAIQASKNDWQPDASDEQLAHYQGEKFSVILDGRVHQVGHVRPAWKQVLELGDEDVDTFISLIALYDVRAQGAFGQFVPVSTDDLLAFRGLARKKSGSYEAADKKRVADSIMRVAQLRVKGEVEVWSHKGRRETQQVNSHIILLDSEYYRPNADGEGFDTSYPAMVSFTVGSVWRPFFTADRQTAQLFRQVLSYHTHHQKFSKRLGLYFTFLFRDRAARNQNQQPILLRTILEGANLMPELPYRNLRRTIEDYVFKAFRQLKTDGIIEDYSYTEPPPGSRAEAWFDTRWIVTPPKAVEEHYRQIFERRQKLLERKKKIEKSKIASPKSKVNN